MMSGTAKGAAKTRDKLLKKNPFHYMQLGQKNKDKPKSIPTGFQVIKELDPELHKEISAKGGRNRGRGNGLYL